MENANSEYVQAIMVFAEGFLYRAMHPWLWPEFIFYNFCSTGRTAKKLLKILHGFTWKVKMSRDANFTVRVIRHTETLVSLMV